MNGKPPLSRHLDSYPKVENRAWALAVTDLLGWDHAKEGDKILNLEEAFDLFNATLDPGTMSISTLTAKNEKSRVNKP